MRKIYSCLVLCTLSCSLMVGGSSKNSDSVSNNVSEKISSLNTTKLPEENGNVEYVVNEDGTYTCNGTIYKYKLVLNHKNKAATGVGTFVILTNDTTLTYKDIFHVMISSSPVDVSDFVLLGIH